MAKLKEHSYNNKAKCIRPDSLGFSKPWKFRRGRGKTHEFLDSAYSFDRINAPFLWMRGGGTKPRRRRRLKSRLKARWWGSLSRSGVHKCHRWRKSAKEWANLVAFRDLPEGSASESAIADFLYIIDYDRTTTTTKLPRVLFVEKQSGRWGKRQVIR